MTAILEKRRSLHKDIVSSQQKNEELKAQLAHLQALANIGTVASMIAHEMNNILTPLANYAQLALNNPTDAALTRKSLEKTILNSGRAAKILESIRTLANGEKLNKKNSRLTLMVEDIFICLCRDFLKDKIAVNIQVTEELTIWAVPVQMQQVLMNLVLNARDAMLPKGGRLSIKASDMANEVQIEVADTGCGIESANIGRIFDPFFSTKTVNSANSLAGAGMGLAFCKHIVDAHNGTISVNSRVGEGTIFTITLPKSP
ncbi:MAG: HAMP domain-containing sensor histidine kinase [Sedimentisphaerales bacterium]|nr:HAMP domain-containing sensor histidine kinase [Sedimentisphaerales bacterium]